MAKKCPTWEGKGVITCKNCGGSGYVGRDVLEILMGHDDKCSRCKGLGEHTCPNGKGKGEVG
jgi:DnaJ-class molecular chaperone